MSRELDALVASKVMKWTNIPPLAFDRTEGGKRRAKWTEGHDAPWVGDDPVSGKMLKIPAYSSEIAAAWAVVERMRARYGRTSTLR